MTCKGYDSKTVKIGKEVKRAAALIRDAHVRGAFLRSFVQIAKADQNRKVSRNRKEAE
jgi:hypothetical protein